MKLHLILILVISITIAYLFNLFTGVHSTKDYFLHYTLPIADVLFTAGLVILLSKNKYCFWFLLVPYSFFLFLYAPTGIKFGYIDFYYLYSLVATNTAESIEFLKSISFTTWVLDILFIVLIFINRQLINKYHKPDTRSVSLVLGILSILWFGYKSLLNPEIPTPTIVKTPKDIISNCLKLYEDINTLKGLESQETKWVIDSVDATYKNYILIIGESQRRDYMNCYGFPYDNTPFMSNNGTVIEGLTAAGFNTISSLRYMLTNTDIKEETPNYKENFVDMANKAGFQTIWISNQGTLGENDTPIAFIAKRASKNIFLKTGKYNMINLDDFELINKFKTELIEKSSKPRLFVFHLMGSHPNAAERIINYPKKVDVNGNKDIEDYVNSIHKTDSLIQTIYTISKNEFKKNPQETFSIIYFADHGLKFYAKGETNVAGHKVDQPGFFVSSETKEVYDIPLFNISSDNYSPKHIQAVKYGKNFTRGLAHWMGITSNMIPYPIDLFSNENDSIIDKSLKLDRLESSPYMQPISQK